MELLQVWLDSIVMDELQKNAGMGLRERKRLATLRTVERAALDLALEHGYEQVTVEMICDVAEISQSTFFNYFGTKEAAFIGVPPKEFPPALVEEFVQGTGPILIDLVTFVIAMGQLGGPDPSLIHARRQLMVDTPALMAAEMAQFSRMDDLARDLVLARFAHAGRTPDTEPGLLDEADMVTGLGAGVMRQTLVRIAREPDQPVEAHLQRTIDLIHRIAGEDLS